MDKNANLMKDTVMLYNSTPGVWLFPDGKVITSYYEAQQKADKLGMNLQMPNLRRFPTHINAIEVKYEWLTHRITRPPGNGAYRRN